MSLGRSGIDHRCRQKRLKKVLHLSLSLKACSGDDASDSNRRHCGHSRRHSGDWIERVGPFDDSIDDSIDDPVGQPTDHSIRHSTNHSSSDSTYYTISHSICHSVVVAATAHRVFMKIMIIGVVVMSAKGVVVIVAVIVVVVIMQGVTLSRCVHFSPQSLRVVFASVMLLRLLH